MQGGVGAHLRSNVVGYVALFLAMTGSAVALEGRNTVDSGDIKNGQVKRADIKANAVNGSRIADGAVTGAEVDEATLGQVPSAATATAASTAGDAGTLDGLDSSAFVRSDAVIDAETLDGIDSAGFLSSNAVLGTANVDESSLFNDNSLDSGDIADGAITPAEMNAQIPFTDAGLPEVNQLNGNCTGTDRWEADNILSNDVAYAVDPFGFVHLRGRIHGCGPNIPELVFTLPSNVRPAKNEALVAATNTGDATVVQIQSNGEVRVDVPNDIFLDGITWSCDGAGGGCD
jgi:hypothetical protein